MTIKVYNGDCAEVMTQLESDSVDAIVTDPPYGLAFMGAEWDSFGDSTGKETIDERRKKMNEYLGANAVVPAFASSHGHTPKLSEMHEFQAAMTPIFAEALRVAKPGAHLLCFGGTRTFHRMASAIEDAGWEIRDCIMWVYGCLDEDTEVLVDGEFVRYNRARKGSLALGYDIESGTFSWQRIEDTYLYDYDDTAYAIQSDSTDQLVSRNHRCIVERGGVEQFALAEQVASEREASVPILESLHDLLDYLPLPNERASCAEQDVLEGVRGESEQSSSEETQGSRAEQDMPCMRETVLRVPSMAEKGKDELLLAKLQEQGGMRSEASSAQQRASREISENGEADSRAAREDDRREEPSVERRGDVSQSPRQLRERAVRAMPEGVSVNGAQGRLRDGASSCGGAGDRQAVEAGGGRASHQSRPARQSTREPDAVSDEQGAQALRSEWGAKTTLARVTPVHYKGKMWCIKVRTGAFVARRHGKIFVTGNSGFPKSMDVAKAIDKASGYVGEVIGERTVDVGMQGGHMHAGRKQQQQQQVFSLSPQAKEWQGWGTCLKPAWEPIIVARKPLDGTVAHNVLTWGTGAINIDACRVPTEDNLNGGRYSHNRDVDSSDQWNGGRMTNYSGKYAVSKNEYVQPEGRFPANLVHDGSEEVVRLFPQSNGQQADVTGNEPSHPADGVCYGEYNGRHSFAKRGDTGSAARFFNTLRDGEESADRTYADKGSTNFAAKPGMRREPVTADRFFYCAKASKKDRGEGNDHPTVKPNALMRWLVRLVCPRGGTVMDPFMGSGSTGLACIDEGMDFIGIEREKHYVEIAEKRFDGRQLSLDLEDLEG